jgi:hypothetical protein
MLSGFSGRSIYHRGAASVELDVECARTPGPSRVGFSTGKGGGVEMRWRQAELNGRVVGIRAAAVVGGCAIVAMIAVSLQPNEASSDTTNLPTAGTMQTGVTSIESVTPASSGPATLATSVASPTKKATPEWGQPPEP